MALPTHIELQVVTPERLIVNEQVDEIQVPGAEGYFGVLPGHTPFLAALAVGEMWFRKGQETFFLSIAGGFAEVLPDRVTLLATLAERAEDIDISRAEAAKQRAEQRLHQPIAEVDHERARIALQKALSRLGVASRVPGTRAGELKRIRETRA